MRTSIIYNLCPRPTTSTPHLGVWLEFFEVPNKMRVPHPYLRVQLVVVRAV